METGGLFSYHWKYRGKGYDHGYKDARITRQNKIRIKLESAFMFWELDYVAMDFSHDLDLKAEFAQCYRRNKIKSGSQ